MLTGVLHSNAETEVQKAVDLRILAWYTLHIFIVTSSLATNYAACTVAKLMNA